MNEHEHERWLTCFPCEVETTPATNTTVTRTIAAALLTEGQKCASDVADVLQWSLKGGLRRAGVVVKSLRRIHAKRLHRRGQGVEVGHHALGAVEDRRVEVAVETRNGGALLVDVDKDGVPGAKVRKNRVKVCKKGGGAWLKREMGLT